MFDVLLAVLYIGCYRFDQLVLRQRLSSCMLGRLLSLFCYLEPDLSPVDEFHHSNTYTESIVRTFKHSNLIEGLWGTRKYYAKHTYYTSPGESEDYW